MSATVALQTEFPSSSFSFDIKTTSKVNKTFPVRQQIFFPQDISQEWAR